MERSIENGNYVFRARQDAPGTAIIGVLAPAEDNTSDRLLVLDEISIERGAARSLYGRAQDFLTIRFRGPEVVLTPNAGQRIVCPDQGGTPSENAVAVVRRHNLERDIWATSIPLGAVDIAALHALSTPVATDEAVASAYEDVERNTGAAIGDLAIGTTRDTSNAWETRYAATSNGGSWDNCKPDPAKEGRLICSGGVSIDLKILSPRRRFPIFGTTPEGYLRLRLLSEPAAAEIFMGPMRQGSMTNTELDVRADDIPTFRFEKKGYEPCSYGSRWTVRIISGPRKIIEAKCKLRRKH